VSFGRGNQTDIRALIQTRLAGWPLRRSAEFANEVGALVASRVGAMPVLTQEIAKLRNKCT
jgi:sugar/nucleoside kinase (ribokinase family)